MNKMKKLFCCFVIAIFTLSVFDLSAQHYNDNIEFRMPKKITHIRGYYVTTMGPGQRYDVLSGDVTSSGRANPNTTISTNGGDRYYRAYGVRSMDRQSVVYNAPMRVEGNSVGALDREPFEDVVVTGSQMRVGRGDTPDDPSVPLGGGVVAMLMFAILWIIIKYHCLVKRTP